MKTGLMVVALAAVVLGGCKTTEEAANSMRSHWVGKPADTFFMSYGPPASEYDMDGGGRIYTWRGGEATSYRPGQFQTQRMPAWTPAGQPQRMTTTTTYQPPRQINYVCEAQITANAQGIIQGIRISRDTDGQGLSFSRCAELFSPD